MDEAEASFGIEKLDESLHGFAAPTNEREEEQDTNSRGESVPSDHLYLRMGSGRVLRFQMARPGL